MKSFQASGFGPLTSKAIRISFSPDKDAGLGYFQHSAIVFLPDCRRLTYLGSGDKMISSSSSYQRLLAGKVSRRRLLQLGGMGLLSSMGLPGTVMARAEVKEGRAKGAKEKSCIYILLCGGPQVGGTPQNFSSPLGSRLHFKDDLQFHWRTEWKTRNTKD